MIGNGSTFRTLGASNHTDHDREVNDYYATDPLAAELLLEVEDLNNIWECACGQMHLANVFEKHQKLGRASDIINRDNDSRIEIYDFLSKPCGLLVERERAYSMTET